ncbi:N-acetyltransferase 8-like isoform X2 [Engystomops pustulosus]
MSGYYIRLYKTSDYHMVRDIFARGTREHIGAAFCRSLSLPQIWIPSLVVTWLPLQITGSPLISTLAAITILGLVWYVSRHSLTVYVDHSLEDDLLDIQEYYLPSADRCFWVAEADGEVVGTVAAAPLLQPGGEKLMELRRLSVIQRYRRQGIAGALCRKVMDFTRRRGYRAVVLDTALYQTGPIILYENMGFRRSGYCYTDAFCTRIMGLTDVRYQYDIPDQK